MSVTYPELVEEKREFVVGTTGWTADDLDDPAFERFWDAGHYEIVEGVLTQMPAAYFDGGDALFELMVLIRVHLKAAGAGGRFGIETDLVLEEMRVARGDAVFLSPEVLRAREAANKRSRRPKGRYGRVRIAPTLIIESISPGHEAHDRVTKRKWYAEAGVANYWILDAFKRTLDCMVLDGDVYRVAQKGKKNDKVKPGLFPGLVIELSELWG